MSRSPLIFRSFGIDSFKNGRYIQVSNFNRKYTRRHGGKSFTTLEAERIHDVLQADAACGFA